MNTATASRSGTLANLPAPAGERVPSFELREILSRESVEVFKALLLKELPAYYDDVDETFPQSIVDNIGRSRDPFGYFTLGKEVYAGYVDGQCAGFTVVTMKRGGAAKIGPTAVVPAFRRTGVARMLRDAVEQKLFTERGVRKLYMTVSAANVPALLFNLSRGFEVEGVLRGQYRENQDELVLGVFNPTAPRGERPAAEPPPQLAGARAGAAEAGVWSDPEAEELRAFLAPRLAGCFDEIDDEFYRAVVAACQESRQSYHQKGKRLVVTRSGGRLAGVAVYVPKRGGGVKLSPCVADDPEAAARLVRECVALARSEGRRKIYVHVPDGMFGMVELLTAEGFTVEAQLREAYRPQMNVLVLGQFL